MTRGRSIRLRMLLLFCAVVGTLLAGTFAGFYFVFERAVRDQLDRRLKETAAPIIADLIVDPDEKDVDQLDIDQEYFEVLDTAGHVVQQSKNLRTPLPLASLSGYQTARTPDAGEIRITIIPFQAGGQSWLFAAASSTRDVEAAVQTLRYFALLLFPASLLLTSVIFSFYANHLFLRIEAVVGELRQFVSDASHEL